MKKVFLYLITFFVTGIFFCFTFVSRPKKPEVRLFGIKKGTVDKLKFISAKKLELINNPDSLWQITGYEFDQNCNGNVFLKYYYTDKVEKEILQMVKDCKSQKSLVDFINIKAKNKKTSEEITLNEIELTVLE